MEVPEGWSVIWVIAGDSVSALRAFGNRTPHAMHVPVSPASLVEAARIRAFPAHIILNRLGEVIAGDVGARLMPLDAYHPDCTIADNVSGA
jgi:hypothetical protein